VTKQVAITSTTILHAHNKNGSELGTPSLAADAFTCAIQYLADQNNVDSQFRDTLNSADAIAAGEKVSRWHLCVCVCQAPANPRF
jgi:hypothetical protein